MAFREKRSISSQTFDKEKAEDVYRAALDFYPEALALFQEIQRVQLGVLGT